MLSNNVHATRAPGYEVRTVTIRFGKLGNQTVKALLVLWVNSGSRGIVGCIDLSNRFCVGDELLWGGHGGVIYCCKSREMIKGRWEKEKIKEEGRERRI